MTVLPCKLLQSVKPEFRVKKKSAGSNIIKLPPDGSTLFNIYTWLKWTLKRMEFHQQTLTNCVFVLLNLNSEYRKMDLRSNVNRQEEMHQAFLLVSQCVFVC